VFALFRRGYRKGWLNLFPEIVNKPDQPTKSPREATK